MEVARRLEVVRQALAQVRRLADVDHPAGGILELVGARRLRDRAGGRTLHHRPETTLGTILCMTYQAYGRPDTVKPDVRAVRRYLPPSTERRVVSRRTVRRHHHRHRVRAQPVDDVRVRARRRPLQQARLRAGPGARVRDLAALHVAVRHRAADLAAARHRVLLVVRPAARVALRPGPVPRVGGDHDARPGTHPHIPRAALEQHRQHVRVRVEQPVPRRHLGVRGDLSGREVVRGHPAVGARRGVHACSTCCSSPA